MYGQTTTQSAAAEVSFCARELKTSEPCCKHKKAIGTSNTCAVGYMVGMISTVVLNTRQDVQLKGIESAGTKRNFQAASASAASAPTRAAL